MTELAAGVGARDLIPGDPDELGRLAARLSVFGEGMSEAGTTLDDVEAVGWTGPAADAFQGLVGEQPAKYRTAGTSFEQAVSAIRAYAGVLRHAQSDAGRAVTMQGSSDLGDDISEGGDEGPSAEDQARDETQQKVDDVLDGAAQGKVKIHDQRFKEGGDAAANRDFDDLADGLPVDEYPGGTRVVNRPDGTSVTYYPESSGGHPTVKIDQLGGGSPIKVRYP